MQLKNIIRIYIRRGESALNRQDLKDFLDTQSEIKSLIYLIDITRNRVQPTSYKPIRFEPLSALKTRHLLEKLYSNRFSDKEAKLFLDQLLYNPDFLFQLESFLAPLSENTQKEVPYPKSSHMLSDEDIYCTVMQKLHSSEQSSFFETVANFINSWRARMKRVTDKNFQSPIPASVRVAAVPIVLLIAVTALLLWPQDDVAQIYDHYFAATQPPHDPVVLSYSYSPKGDGSTAHTRSLDSLEQDSLKVLHLFQFGQSKYFRKNYQSAIATFRQLESRLEFSSSYSVRLQRDTYFYLGMSYLARSEGTVDNEADLTGATTYLQQAFELSKKFELSHHDEVAFFLGMSYILLNEPDNARDFLESIEPSSSFYNQSMELLN